MKPMFMAILAMAVLASSCRKEKTNVDTTPPAQQVRLTKIITTRPDQVSEEHFMYNTDGYLNEYNSYSKKTGGNAASWELSARITFTRDGNNLITNEERSYPMAGSFAGTYVYENNVLAKVTYLAAGRLTQYAAYTWKDGNITDAGLYGEDGSSPYKQMVSYDGTGNVKQIEIWQTLGSDTGYTAVTHRNIQYDDKPNYITTIKGLSNLIYIMGISPQTLSPHNVLRYETDGDPYYQTGPNTTVYQIEYNEYNYVSKETVQGGNKVREFFYEVIK